MRQPSRTLALRPRVSSALESLRPTRAEIDLGALAHNLASVRGVAGSARVLAVVKADAYGHGVVPVALRLEEAGVDGFGVALAEEGLELREAGVGSQILVLNGVYGDAHEDVLHASLTPVVYDLGQVEAFARAARGAPFRIHVKVDTGMSRLGVQVEHLEAFLDGLERHAGAVVEGVMTHFATADSDPSYALAQLERFRHAVSRVRARGHTPTSIHAANTAATLGMPQARFDLVRPGLALFGYASAPGAGVDLRPVMRFRTEVIALRDLAPGTPVGYDCTFRASRPTRVATLPVGYGDGLMRCLGNRAEMLVRGGRAKIVGNVSMDLTTLDVTDLPDVAVGDEVVILGEPAGAEATFADGASHARPDVVGAHALAAAAGTIPYEILTNVSRRVPRFYR